MRTVTTLCALLLLTGTSWSEPTSSLVAYYPFSGNTNDESGNGLHGTPYGVTMTPDRFGNANSACSFNGVDSYIEVLDDDSLDIGDGESVTVCLWLRTTTTTQWSAISKYRFSDPSRGGFLISSVGGRVCFEGRDRATYYRTSGLSSTYVSDGCWHFVAGMRSGSVWSIWVDGALENSNDVSSSSAMDNACPLVIGCANNGNNCSTGRVYYFTGQIDEVRIYTRALSADEVLSLCTSVPRLGFVTLSSSGPPDWEYQLHWVGGCLGFLTFSPVCPGTNGWVTGEAASAGWTANAYTNSVTFTAGAPLTSGSLSGFILSHPWCSHPLMWFAGDSSGTIDGPLPVELLGISAAAMPEGIELQWNTASETNNDFFEIMRGTSQADAFARIATLPSQGNTASGHHYEYLDREVTAGQTYWYYLADVDLNGNRTEHREIMRSATMTGSAELPSDYALSAYPNPFNPSTTISFALPEADVVRIAVFDVAGRWIQTLVNEKRGAGNHTVSFDARDLPSGVYFARMESGRFAVTKKMALIR